MTGLPLEPVSVEGMETFANEYDALRDLMVFVNYLSQKSVKRVTRSNQIPKPDAIKIARLLGYRELEGDIKENGSTEWIDFIDDLALKLGLVHYAVEGSYSSYSDSGAMYYDNHILVDKNVLIDFYNLSPVSLEKRMLERLIANAPKDNYYSYYSENEFFRPSVLGKLDPFNDWAGVAMRIVPLLDFAQARRFLLKILEQCEAGVWYSTSSLIAYLKANHRYFLIPEKLPPDRWGKPVARYSSFYEYDQSASGVPIPDDAPDGFERVEGRYVERFLEHAPLTMRFVELAYSYKTAGEAFPSFGYLKAFRVTERFLRIQRGEIQPPRVVVQPNFDVIVESELYPARVMRLLEPLTERISSSTVGGSVSLTTMRLKKERFAAEQARNPNLKALVLLKNLTGRALPPNVVAEIDEWVGHAERFVLYDGYCLLESSEPVLEAHDQLVEQISDRFYLARDEAALLAALEQDQLAPLQVVHPKDALATLPEEVETQFPRKNGAAGETGRQDVGRPPFVDGDAEFPGP